MAISSRWRSPSTPGAFKITIDTNTHSGESFDGRADIDDVSVKRPSLVTMRISPVSSLPRHRQDAPDFVRPCFRSHRTKVPRHHYGGGVWFAALFFLFNFGRREVRKPALDWPYMSLLVAAIAIRIAARVLKPNARTVA